MNSKILFLILSLSTFLGCGASKQDSGREAEIRAAKERMAMDPGPTIPPNNCRVAATVVAIDKSLKGTSEKDPCGKAPCMATVRIDSVLGYGSAFGKTFSPKENISVRFSNTLNATGKDFPEVNPPLPGLSVGSRFVALISSSMTMGQSEPAYTIHGYQKK